MLDPNAAVIRSAALACLHDLPCSFELRRRLFGRSVSQYLRWIEEDATQRIEKGTEPGVDKPAYWVEEVVNEARAGQASESDVLRVCRFLVRVLS